MADTVTSNRAANTGSSAVNALAFFVDSLLRGGVNTAIPVRVDSCTAPGPGESAGYVSATPLVCQRDARGDTLPPVSIPRLPFLRIQCGRAALVADPQPGDIGLAVFAQQDCSRVTAGTEQPVPAGSFRCFDMSDGFYLGGFMGPPPDTFIHLDPENGEIRLNCPQKVTVESPELEIRAADSVALNTPLVRVAGRIVQSGELGAGAGSEFRGGFTNTGGQITSNGVTLETHTHGGVETGSGSTGGPN